MSGSGGSSAFKIDSKQDGQNATGFGDYAGGGNVYNVGGFSVPEFPNFGGNGISAKVSVGGGTSYALAGAAALVVMVLLVAMKKKKGGHK